MKAFIAFTLLVIFVCAEAGANYGNIDPIFEAVKKNLNSTQFPTEERCGEIKFDDYSDLKARAMQLSSGIEGKIIQATNDPNERDGLVRIINRECYDNLDLDKLSRKLASKVQDCLGENSKLTQREETSLAIAMKVTVCKVIKLKAIMRKYGPRRTRNQNKSSDSE